MDVLARRRIQIDPRYKNRSLFVTERSRGLSASIFVDLETRGRARFEPATVIALEQVYELPDGWLSDALAGDIRPLPRPGSLQRVDIAGAFRALVTDETTDEQLDDLEHRIVAADVPPPTRLAMYVVLQDIRKERAARGGGTAAGKAGLQAVPPGNGPQCPRAAGMAP